MGRGEGRHPFHPLVPAMTGVTAGHNFITPVGGGKIIMEFSGKELVRGEPDASSFPSGGLRATFEAGATPPGTPPPSPSSGGSLSHPHHLLLLLGQALDKRRPCCGPRMNQPSRRSRILRLFSDTETKRVIPQVGPGRSTSSSTRPLQSQREDLRFCGRTLFGKPPRARSWRPLLRRHPPRVAAMKDLDETLWALGVLSKTKHNRWLPPSMRWPPFTPTPTAPATRTSWPWRS